MDEMTHAWNGHCVVCFSIHSMNETILLLHVRFLVHVQAVPFLSESKLQHELCGRAACTFVQCTSASPRSRKEICDWRLADAATTRMALEFCRGCLSCREFRSCRGCLVARQIHWGYAALYACFTVPSRKCYGAFGQRDGERIPG